MSDAFDLGSSVAQGPSLERLVAAANDIVATERLVKELEQNLDGLRRQLHHKRTRELPDLMAECGMTEFKTTDGYKITVDDFVAGTLPKEEDRREEAIRWLEANDGASLIKTSLSISFSKTQHNEALSLKAELENRGYDVDAKMGVHPQTLIANVKERLENGDEVPLELLGLYAGRTVKIKPLKPGRK